MDIGMEKFVTQFQLADEADKLAEAIIRQYAKYNVRLTLTRREPHKGRFIFRVKLKGNTREAHIRAHASDVQLRLKLPVFYVEKHDLTLVIITSRQKIRCDGFLTVLDTPACRENMKQMKLPYIIGHDVVGEVVMEDLSQFPHLLLGGSTNSGKSVGLQALITSIICGKLPSQVNFILIDVGAANLMPFEGLPHLSCPVVRDRVAAIHALAALNAEMERRIALEYTNRTEFGQLPRLVLVIDEFSALFMGGIDKNTSRTLTDTVSSLLQRGRHAKIHVVLAAQNPTFQDMKVDLGNITARIAFKCAKKNFSETILGEGGAENLSGQGDLLFKSPQYNSLQRIQGVYIAPKELHQIVQIFKAKPCATANKFTLTIPSVNPARPTDPLEDRLSCSVARRWPSETDQLLASVILWELAHDSISTNMLMNEYQLGWNRASKLVKRLEELGIADRPEGKLPRKVIPGCPEDIPEKLMEFLQASGYSQHAVIDAFYGS